MTTSVNGPTMFDLDDLVPGWAGARITTLREPMSRGLATLETQLTGATAALIITVTHFGFDDTWGGIESIEPLAEAGAALSRAAEIVERKERALLEKNPGWRVLTREPHATEVLPATGGTVPGTFARLLAGVKVGDPELYESAYIRASVVETEGGATLVNTILGLSGLVEELADYLIRLGKN